MTHWHYETVAFLICDAFFYSASFSSCLFQERSSFSFLFLILNTSSIDVRSADRLASFKCLYFSLMKTVILFYFLLFCCLINIPPTSLDANLCTFSEEKCFGSLSQCIPLLTSCITSSINMILFQKQPCKPKTKKLPPPWFTGVHACFRS